ncbi:MAG TPA: YciK family oxidoreductase [Gammaproteobacteria bacterium]|nr:YciK family oxidoreductase [Gammaproteobacteria bacterium]
MAQASGAPADWREYRPAVDALAGRVILVTGATAGIGRAVARALAAHGATLLLHGRSAKKLDELYRELARVGPEPAVAELDFERAQGPQYQSLTDEIDKRFGRVDGLLHNAGILGDRSPIEHYDFGVWQRVLHVNLTAPFVLTRCLLPLLRKSEDASVLFTTSSVGSRGRAFWGAYAVAKFGTEGLAQVLAEELENTPIRVNTINPGATRTRMRAQAYPAENPETLRTPDEVVLAYLYLLGPASRGVRGQRIDVQQRAR